MKKFIRTIYQSFYSKDLYSDAAYKWRGTGVSLFAWLGLVAAIVIVMPILAVNPAEYSKFKNELIAQTPEVAIKNGNLSIDKPSPYYIKIDEKEKFLLIDTSDAANKLTFDQILQKMKQEKLVMFANKTDVVTMKSDSESRVYSLAEVKEDFSFGKKEVAKLVGIIEVAVVPFLLLFMFLFIWVYKIFQMLIYSVFAILMNNFIKTGLDYSALQRITVCAIFPATIIGFAAGLAGTGLPLLLSVACTLVFIFFGLKSTQIVK